MRCAVPPTPSSSCTAPGRSRPCTSISIACGTPPSSMRSDCASGRAADTSGSSLGSAAELRAVERSASDDGAQLTLDLSEGAQHKLFSLEHPDRVVVDLPNTHLADGVRAPGPEGVVTEVRFGAQPDGTLRVVAELKSALPAHSGWVPDEEGHRLILTIGAPVAP